jgi:CHAD domain-containing protein
MHDHNILSLQATDARPDAKAVGRRVATYRARAVAFAHALRDPPFPPETVHRLRTHLRRLQAYAEFLQRPVAAARLAACVSWLSRMRMFYVFLTHLRRKRAPGNDVRRVRAALREEERTVAEAGCLEAIQTVLAVMTSARMRRSKAFLEERLAALDRDHAERLTEALRSVSADATRKELHRLRLLVKSLRYQEEAAVEAGWGRSQQVAALKRLQRRLGDFCDHDQFRRLATKMGLACRREMEKDCRQSRKRARAAVRTWGVPSGLQARAGT